MTLIAQAPEIFAAWCLWCAGHSLFAAEGMKKRFARLVRGRRYRLLYVVASLVSLAGLVIWQQAVVREPAARYPLWQGARAVLFAYGLFMFAAASRAYDTRAFLGLAEEREEGLATGGILARVRHPWYSGGIALAAAMGQTPLDRVDLRLLIAAYLVFGCLIEDRRLARRFGKEFAEYRENTPMLLPRLRRTRAPS